MDDNFFLKDKHIVIIGASSGIGEQIAIDCSKRGAKLSICSRNVENLANLVKNLSGKNHGYEYLDVTNCQNMEEIFDRFVKARGRIDGFVYCSGILKNMNFNTIKEKHYNAIFGVNFLGAMQTTQAATNFKRVSKSGCSVVWISSVACTKPGGAGGFLYASSKAALIGGMKVLAIELAEKKIRINAICPGAIDTNIWNINTMSDEEKNSIFKRHLLGIGNVTDVSNSCIYLLSEASKWVTGTQLFVDGGFLLT